MVLPKNHHIFRFIEKICKIYYRKKPEGFICIDISVYCALVLIKCEYCIVINCNTVVHLQA